MIKSIENRVDFSNLSYLTNETTLKTYFLSFGSIERLILFRDDQSQSLRKGYLIYTDQKSVNDLMGKRPHKIDQRQIFLQRSIPTSILSSMRNVSLSDSLANQLTVNEIFPSRLSRGDRREMFLNYFQRFGRIVDCRMFNNSSSNSKQSGFAFVRFDDYDSVDQVILSRPHYINSKFYPVRKCIPRQYSYIISSVKPLSSNKPIWRHYALGLIDMQTETILYPSRVNSIVQSNDRSERITAAETERNSSPTNDFEFVNTASSMTSSISIVNSIHEDFTPIASPIYSTAIAYSPTTDLI